MKSKNEIISAIRNTVLSSAKYYEHCRIPYQELSFIKEQSIEELYNLIEKYINKPIFEVIDKYWVEHHHPKEFVGCDKPLMYIDSWNIIHYRTDYGLPLNCWVECYGQTFSKNNSENVGDAKKLLSIIFVNIMLNVAFNYGGYKLANAIRGET